MLTRRTNYAAQAFIAGFCVLHACRKLIYILSAAPYRSHGSVRRSGMPHAEDAVSAIGRPQFFMLCDAISSTSRPPCCRRIRSTSTIRSASAPPPDRREFPAARLKSLPLHNTRHDAHADDFSTPSRFCRREPLNDVGMVREYRQRVARLFYSTPRARRSYFRITRRSVIENTFICAL